MISGKLVHLMDSHQEAILDRVEQLNRRDPDMRRSQAILGSGRRHWNKELLEDLSQWLGNGTGETLAVRYRGMGRERFEQGIRLSECMRDLCLLKETLLDYVQEHTFNKDSVELYAEEELDRRVGRFFDLLIVHIVRGYESAPKPQAAA